MIEIYWAGSQLRKVRAFMLVSLVCAGACMWWGCHLFRSHGLRPIEGGELAPLAERLAWGGGVASLGVLFVVGMGLYGRMYVASVRFEQRTNKLHVATVGFFSTRERLVDVSEVLGSTYHHGRMRRASVNAPWTTLRMAGQRLPLLVDGRGKVMNPDLAWKLLGVENVVSTGFS